MTQFFQEYQIISNLSPNSFILPSMFQTFWNSHRKPLSSSVWVCLKKMVSPKKMLKIYWFAIELNWNNPEFLVLFSDVFGGL